MYNLSQEVMAHMLCNVSDKKPVLDGVQVWSDKYGMWLDTINYEFNIRGMIFRHDLKYRVKPK